MEFIKISVLILVCGIILLLIFIYLIFSRREVRTINYDFPIIQAVEYDNESINQDTSECVICRNPLDVYIITYCQHKFHKLCIINWCKSQLEEQITPSCPICRYSLVDNSMDTDSIDDDSIDDDSIDDDSTNPIMFI